MARRRSKKIPRWSMFPSLHDDVATLLLEDDLHMDFHDGDDETCRKEYDTNVMGRFQCRNPSCDKGGWSSRKIPITIRMYHAADYNARVYHQRCKDCGCLSRPTLDDSYAERVAYRLKKWCGIEQEEPQYRGASKGPVHQTTLCEGCKAGHCSEMVSEWSE